MVAASPVNPATTARTTVRHAERWRRLWSGFPDLVALVVLLFAVLIAMLALWP